MGWVRPFVKPLARPLEKRNAMSRSNDYRHMHGDLVSYSPAFRFIRYFATSHMLHPQKRSETKLKLRIRGIPSRRISEYPTTLEQGGLEKCSRFNSGRSPERFLPYSSWVSATNYTYYDEAQHCQSRKSAAPVPSSSGSQAHQPWVSAETAAEAEAAAEKTASA